LRRKLAGRGVLIILDNARDADHVRPLLPALATSAVIITSRHQLSTMGMGEDAVPIRLPELTRQESIQLLRQRINSIQRAGDDEAIRDLASLCGDLPLGLRIAADRAAATPQVPFRELVDELRERRQLLLEEGAHGDDNTRTLRAVFGFSVDSLAPAVGEFFTLLGLFPGTRFSVRAVAALTNRSIDDAEHILRVLLNASLIDGHGRSRYKIHDLLHLFASQRASAIAPETRRPAIRRLLDWFVASLHNAVERMDPRGEDSPLSVAEDVRPQEFDDADQALAWCKSERDNLIACIGYSFEHGFHQQCWLAASELTEYLNRDSDPLKLLDINHTGLLAAVKCMDREGVAELQNNLGSIYYSVGRYDEAADYFQEAIRGQQEIGNVNGVAIGTMNLATIHLVRSNYRTALDLLQESAVLFDNVGNRTGQAHVTQRMGDVYCQMENYDIAYNKYLSALKRRRTVGHARGEGESWAALGKLELLRDHPDKAITYATNALTVCQHTLDEPRTAEALETLSRATYAVRRYDQAARYAADAITHYAATANLRGESRGRDLRALANHMLGHDDLAIEDWTQALDTLRELGDDQLREVEAHLANAHIARTSIPVQKEAGSPVASASSGKVRSEDTGDPAEKLR
jgi:tetratricopeptide (TPR) repeat protein